MKILFRLFVGVVILFLVSSIYREKVTPITTHFPIERLNHPVRSEVPLNLILFFSINSCPPCLKVIDVLNQVSEKLVVVGVVLEKEMKYLNEIRQMTGARFPIQSFNGWKRFRPNFAPTLFGVGPDGNIYFILPCVGLEETYLSRYLEEFTRKAGYLLHVSRN